MSITRIEDIAADDTIELDGITWAVQGVVAGEPGFLSFELVSDDADFAIARGCERDAVDSLEIVAYQ